jgi:hypothetical protein
MKNIFTNIDDNPFAGAYFFFYWAMVACFSCGEYYFQSMSDSPCHCQVSVVFAMLAYVAVCRDLQKIFS